MTILLTGATGAVGRPLLDELLHRGERVRALTRTPDRASLPPQAEVVGGDLADPPAGLFDGVDRVFVFPADGGVDRFVDTAVAMGVRRFVVLSSLAAAKEFPRDEGSASQLHHSAIEEAVTRRTDDWTILRPGTFAGNLRPWSFQIRAGAPIRAPYLDSAQAPIHEADIASAAAVALTESGHAGRAYPLTGPEALTRREQIAVIAAEIGQEIPVIEITPDEFREDMRPYAPDAIVSMLLDYWRDTEIEPDRIRPVTPLTGRPGRTLATWVRDHREEFV